MHWLEKDFPFELVGTMTLNRNVENIFAETESVGYNPGALAEGANLNVHRYLETSTV